MRVRNEVLAAKCSDRWIGLRSPVSCAKPTTSDDDTVLVSRSAMPTERSSKNKVRSGGRFGGDSFMGALEPRGPCGDKLDDRREPPQVHNGRNDSRSPSHPHLGSAVDRGRRPAEARGVAGATASLPPPFGRGGGPPWKQRRSISAARGGEPTDQKQNDGGNDGDDAVPGVDVRRACLIAGHESRQRTGRHDEIDHGGEQTNNRKNVDEHSH